MKLHADAALSLNKRRLLAERVVLAQWTVSLNERTNLLGTYN
jgi:hypothetical protein